MYIPIESIAIIIFIILFVFVMTNERCLKWLNSEKADEIFDVIRLVAFIGGSIFFTLYALGIIDVPL